MRKCLVSLSLLISAGSFAGNVSDLINTGGGTIGSWLGNAVYKLQTPGTYESQSSRYYYGGGFSLRTPQKTYQLFSVQPPRLQMGCGGIDFTFGSFGYLQPEYLVEFGKTVMQIAPAFAFKTAIEVFCPTCEDVMTKLENLANLMNSMQLDSCRFAQFISDYTKDKLLSAKASRDTESGDMEFYLKKIDDASKTARDVFNQFMSGGLERSEVVREIRNIVNSTGKIRISIVDDVMPRLTDSNKIGGISLVKDADFRKLVKALFGDVLEVTSAIADRVVSRTALDPQHLEFLAMFPFPAYRLLNAMSIYPGILQQYAEDLAVYFAYDLATLMLTEYLRAYVHTLVSLKNSDLATERTVDSINAALKWAHSTGLPGLMETARRKKEEVKNKLIQGIEMVRKYEQEAARLLGGDPTYQSVLWSQGAGLNVGCFLQGDENSRGNGFSSHLGDNVQKSEVFPCPFFPRHFGFPYLIGTAFLSIEHTGPKYLES